MKAVCTARRGTTYVAPYFGIIEAPPRVTGLQAAGTVFRPSTLGATLRTAGVLPCLRGFCSLVVRSAQGKGPIS